MLKEVTFFMSDEKKDKVVENEAPVEEKVEGAVNQKEEAPEKLRATSTATAFLFTIALATGRLFILMVKRSDLKLLATSVLSLTVSFTVYFPGFAKTCSTIRPSSWLPSPKSHRKWVISPSLS